MTWEYKTVIFKVKYSANGRLEEEISGFEEQLNELGKEGWELITFLPQEYYGIEYVAVLKRAK